MIRIAVATTLLVVAPVLLGRSLASYMLWDAIRGLDYLESRP